MSKTENKITSGTKEWSDSSVNIFSGCKHDCLYCYAKKMAIRFKRKTSESWPVMELNTEAYNKNFGKRKGRIMFPTSHDITRDTLLPCIFVLKKLLRAGNKVLITTKPDPHCVEEICQQLSCYKKQIQFRFTITSIDDITLRKWEPGAPSFSERLNALKFAHAHGWKTSISIEPFLDLNPIPLIRKISKFVSESIWIGHLNYQKTEFNTLENVIKVVNHVKKLPEEIRAKMRFKDSIKNQLAKGGIDIARGRGRTDARDPMPSSRDRPV